MKNYIIYHMPYKKPLEQICIIGIVDSNISDDGLINKIDKFIKNNFKQLVYQCVELVLVNQETGDAEYRFNYLTDSDNEDDNDLRPVLDILESAFFYEFYEAYYQAFGVEFKGNKDTRKLFDKHYLEQD